VQAAVAKDEPEPPAVVKPNVKIVRAERVPTARRPFSRAEREQLAAELRLISTDDNDPELIDK
jgi:hypothetical protein